MPGISRCLRLPLPVFLLCCAPWLAPLPPTLESAGAAEARFEISPRFDDRIDLQLGEVVVVAVSGDVKSNWGHFQFPKLSPLPQGEILLTFNDSADDNAAYGHPGPAFVSRDQGKTWQAYQGTERAIAISHSPISAVAGGEYLCLPFGTSLDVRKIDKMPAAVGEYFCYANRKYYLLSECPPRVKQYASELPGYRWTPATGKWVPEKIRYELDHALIWTSEQSNGSILSRNSFEYPLLAAYGELYYPDFKFRYLNRDGKVPAGMVVTCMVSRDNGRSFESRGVIGGDESGKEHPSETAIAATGDDGLVCVGRATCESRKPMWITYSRDRGRTWSDRETFWPFGVMPLMTRLDQGFVVLTYGRPGMHLMVSVDGRGREWTQPRTLLAGDKSCGYASHLKIGTNELLLAYTDFAHSDTEGQTRKAILVRRVEVRSKK